MFIINLIEISLEQVRKTITEMSRRQLPGIIPFPVHESFISAFVSQWEELCLKSFCVIEQVLRSAAHQACNKHFGRFQTSGLLVEVK
jgi:hypothetical protein